MMYKYRVLKLHAIINEIESFGLNVIGLYTNKCYDTNHLKKMGIDEDVDLRIAVNNSEIASRYLQKTNVGVKLDIPEFQYVRSFRSDDNNLFLLDISIFAKRNLADVESILTTHLQDAASTELYYGEVLYDPFSFLTNLQGEIKQKFEIREFIQQRVNWISQKIIFRSKFEEESEIDYFWRNYGRVLMYLGYAITTRYLLPPSTRTYSKKLYILSTKHKGMEEIYAQLEELWGFNKFSEHEFLEIIMYLESDYEFITAESVVVDYLHPLKRNYWIAGIKKIASQYSYKEALFPTLYLIISIFRTRFNYNPASLSFYKRVINNWMKNCNYDNSELRGSNEQKVRDVLNQISEDWAN